MAKESLNKIEVAGKVVSIETKTGVTKNGKEYLAGKVLVEAGTDNIIPIDFFANKIKNDGNPNPLYASLTTVVNEFKTISINGRDEADTIEINSAKVKENAFYTQDGKLVRGFSLDSAFFNRKPGAEPKADFTVTGEIVSIVEEPTETGMEILLRMLIIGYGNTANLIDFKVENPQAVDYVRNAFSAGQEVKLSGKVIVSEEKIEKVEEAAFGNPIVTIFTKTSRKLLVTAATPPVDSTLDAAERQTMLATREARLSESKEKSANKAPATKTANSAANFTL